MTLEQVQHALKAASKLKQDDFKKRAPKLYSKLLYLPDATPLTIAGAFAGVLAKCRNDPKWEAEIQNLAG